MKHSLANSSAFTYSAELGLEECPSDQESDTAMRTRTDISKQYHSSSIGDIVEGDADLSDTEEIVAYQLGSSLVGHTRKYIAQARKYIGQDAALPAPNSETVVLMRCVLLSDQAHRGEGMISPPPSFWATCYRMYGVSSMGKSHENDNTVLSRDSRVEGSTQGGKQRTGVTYYGLRSTATLERVARYHVKERLRDRGSAFYPLIDDVNEESLRSAWEHAHIYHEQKLDRASTAENRRINRARKLMAQDAAVPVSGSEAVCLTVHRTSLSGEFPEGNDVGGTEYSAAFSKPLKIREFHIKHESCTPTSGDGCGRLAREKYIGRDAAVPDRNSETVVPMRCVLLSDQAHGGGMISSPPPSVSSYVLQNNGVGSMDKSPKDRLARELPGQKGIVPVSGSKTVYPTGYTSTPAEAHSGGPGTCMGEEQVLGTAGTAVNYPEQKSHTPRAQTVTLKSNAPVEGVHAGSDEEDTAVPQLQAATVASHVPRSVVSSRDQESVSAVRRCQSDAGTEAHNELPSYVPHIQTTILKGGDVNNANQLADAKKAATKKYARKLLKYLIPGSDSEDVTLTGYVSSSEKILYNYVGSDKKERGTSQEESSARSHRTTQHPNIVFKNDVNSMLPDDENDDSVTPPFVGRALTQKEIPTLRRKGMELIDRALSMQTPSSAIRKLEFEEVPTGSAAMKDIYRSSLHIYGVHDDALGISSVNFLTGMRYIPKTPATLHESSLEQYPSEELCNLLKVTKEEYKSNLDTFGYRAVTALTLRELIHSAADKEGKTVTDIHPVLIEELVTTLSQACICGFPPLEVQLSGHNIFAKSPPEKRHMTMKPLTMRSDRGLHIDFKSENELSVYSHFYPLPWLGGYVATHVWYDVSVSPDTGQLHYKNFVVRIAFPGADKVSPEQELCSKIDVDLASAEGVTIFHSVPSVMPVVGFMLEWNLPDESIPIVDMFSVRPAKTTTTIRDSVELTRKRFSGTLPSTEHDETSESEVSIERQEEGTKEFSISDFMKSVLMRLCGLVIDCILLIVKSIGEIMKSIGDLLLYGHKPWTTHADEKESCSTERDAVEAVDISISNGKEDIDLTAELPKEKASPLSVDNDISEGASTKKAHVRRRRGARRNTASAHLGDEDAAKTDDPAAEHARVRRKRSKSMAAYMSTRCPDSYLSDSDIDELSHRSRNL